MYKIIIISNVKSFRKAIHTDTN